VATVYKVSAKRHFEGEPERLWKCRDCGDRFGSSDTVYVLSDGWGQEDLCKSCLDRKVKVTK
jgi:hypothetical protein